MPSDEIVKFLISDIKEIKQDVKHLMRFRWMVMGGALASSVIFGILVEVAKAMARGK